MFLKSLLHRTLERLCVTCALMAIFASAAANAQSGGTEQSVIRIWGHGHRGQDYIQTLLTAWQEGFRKSHPDARFEDRLYGNASAIGSLFTGTGDLAIMDRRISFIEHDAYKQGTGHEPFGIPVARGSVSMPHHARALVVYVNHANPLTRLTLQQLDGIFDADHRLGNRRYTTWGDLGLTGEWAQRPIRLYTYAIDSAKVQFFEHAALNGSQKFPCGLTVFQAKPSLSAERQIAAAVENDVDGLALSVSTPGLKAIALSSSDAAPAVFATPATITADTYPLARTVYIYANRKPHSPVPPKVAAFLAYIVSPEGQAIVARTVGYLPLPPELDAKARETLQ